MKKHTETLQASILKRALGEKGFEELYAQYEEARRLIL